MTGTDPEILKRESPNPQLGKEAGESIKRYFLSAFLIKCFKNYQQNGVCWPHNLNLPLSDTNFSYMTNKF